MKRHYDIIVIGGGHAGAEAAWAASRLGAQTALFSLDPTRIAQMSCNPAIGGLAKGQMVREIDALGGLMGIASDNTGIQFRMLNRSKGPAVWGPRAQADKYKYARQVQQLLSTCPNLDVLPGEVVEIVAAEGDEAEGDTETRGQGNQETEFNTSAPPPPIKNQKSKIKNLITSAVLLADGTRISCRAVIVTTGTFLRGLMHTGERKTEGGRFGEPPARGLSASLARLGLDLGRLKTGTPPRLHRQSIDFAALPEQPGDPTPAPFSYLNEYAPSSIENQKSKVKNPWIPPLAQISCHLSSTNALIHQIIRANLHRAPMYSGQIQSTGPRYCPSIEDKVVRFADKESHQIFLEPEGLDTDEIYCNGISTSLPADVQEQIIPLIPGLEKARILRHGYAIEYDMVWPSQIRSTLQTKAVAGLFLAGQINGTSGYEEAAAQGLIAGINAVRYLQTGNADFILRRDQAYIGVLIDDLITKPPVEPYRMFTSRAEHRLHLRNDNADERLTALGRQVGLVDDHRWARFQALMDARQLALQLLRQTRIDGLPALDCLKRADMDWPALAGKLPAAAAIPPEVGFRLEIAVKYEGYIQRQDRQIERFAQLENKLIPPSLDYSRVVGLRNEARQKLARFTPHSLGQALRISGITPADITVLAIHLERK